MRVIRRQHDPLATRRAAPDRSFLAPRSDQGFRCDRHLSTIRYDDQQVHGEPDAYKSQPRNAQIRGQKDEQKEVTRSNRDPDRRTLRLRPEWQLQRHLQPSAKQDGPGTPQVEVSKVRQSSSKQEPDSEPRHNARKRYHRSCPFSAAVSPQPPESSLATTPIAANASTPTVYATFHQPYGNRYRNGMHLSLRVTCEEQASRTGAR